MSIFSKILDKLGLKAPTLHPEPLASAAKPATPAAAVETKPQSHPVTTHPQSGVPLAHPAGEKPGAQMPPPPAGVKPGGSLPPHPSGMKPASEGPAVPPPAAAVKPMEMVDVVGKLDQLAKANPQKLNWKTSIVDLLKLLDIESSFEARKELAVELGCPPEKMGDSAAMNIWLHKTVLQKLAENGGNIPKELLD